MQQQHHKIIVPKMDESLPQLEILLRSGTEYRFEVDSNQKAIISLLAGKVEIFGREITLDQPVTITNAGAAVYAINDSNILVILAHKKLLVRFVGICVTRGIRV